MHQTIISTNRTNPNLNTINWDSPIFFLEYFIVIYEKKGGIEIEAKVGWEKVQPKHQTGEKGKELESLDKEQRVLIKKKKKKKRNKGREENNKKRNLVKDKNHERERTW